MDTQPKTHRFWYFIFVKNVYKQVFSLALFTSHWLCWRCSNGLLQWQLLERIGVHVKALKCFAEFIKVWARPSSIFGPKTSVMSKGNYTKPCCVWLDIAINQVLDTLVASASAWMYYLLRLKLKLHCAECWRTALLNWWYDIWILPAMEGTFGTENMVCCLNQPWLGDWCRNMCPKHTAWFAAKKSRAEQHVLFLFAF